MTAKVGRVCVPGTPLSQVLQPPSPRYLVASGGLQLQRITRLVNGQSKQGVGGRQEEYTWPGFVMRPLRRVPLAPGPAPGAVPALDPGIGDVIEGSGVYLCVGEGGPPAADVGRGGRSVGACERPRLPSLGLGFLPKGLYVSSSFLRSQISRSVFSRPSRSFFDCIWLFSSSA